MAGDLTVIDNDIAGVLLAILQGDGEPERLRETAAIAFGPVLDQADTVGFSSSEDMPISKRTFRTIQESLLRLFKDIRLPTVVRRRILEASVRAPQDWYPGAIRTAYASGDEDWKLTAVFCMRWVRGFKAKILEALESGNPDIHLEAVRAAGVWSVAAAWSHVVALVTSPKTDRPILLAAIEAVASIRPKEADAALGALVDSSDREINRAVFEALVLRGDPWDEDADDDDDEEEADIDSLF
jgi:hypothetical protein